MTAISLVLKAADAALIVAYGLARAAASEVNTPCAPLVPVLGST